MVFELPGSFTTGKVNYEAMQKIGAINTRALTRFSEVQAELTSFGIESTLEQSRLLTDVKKYGSLLAIESNLAEKYCNRLVEMTSMTTELMMKSGDEMMALVEDMFVAGSTKTKPPVVKAKPVTSAKAKPVKSAKATPVKTASPKKKATAKKTTTASAGAAKRKTVKKTA